MTLSNWSDRAAKNILTHTRIIVLRETFLSFSAIPHTQIRKLYYLTLSLNMLRSLSSRITRSSVRRFCDLASVPAVSRSFEHIQVSVDERTAVIKIHRPKEMNILTPETTAELTSAVKSLDADSSVSTIVISGTDRVFSAGTDISSLPISSYHAARFRHDEPSWTDEIASCKKPVIAAVCGFALGGGCELALASDIVIAEKNATFGTPEVQLGVLPGAGGIQRLVKAVGKAKAMELVLTGRQMGAIEAEGAGLVTRVAEKGEGLNEAMRVAEVIGKHSMPVVQLAKECVNLALEVGLTDGLKYEKRALQGGLMLDDAKEGVKAFTDQRKPSFKNR